MDEDLAARVDAVRAHMDELDELITRGLAAMAAQFRGWNAALAAVHAELEAIRARAVLGFDPPAGWTPEHN